MKKILLSLCGLILMTLVTNAQLATFNFFGLTPSSATASAASADPNVTVSALTRGAGAAGSTGNNSFRTVGFQNNGIATNNTDYFQVTVTVKSGYTASFTSLEATFLGTATFYANSGVSSQFAYSLDGMTFNLIGNPIQITSGNLQNVNHPFDAATLSALTNVAEGTTITFRYYASGQTATGGWGFNSPVDNASNNFLINGSTSAVILPLSVSDINLTKRVSSVQLDFSLGCSTQFITYEVQRSFNGINFESIHSKKVSQADCNFPFKYTDNAPLNNVNYYRIKSSSSDGDLKYSPVAKVNFGAKSYFNVYPTQATASVQVSWSAEKSGPASINIVDASGRLIKSINTNAQSGSNTQSVDVNMLTSGKYFMFITGAEGKSTTASFLKN